MPGKPRTRVKRGGAEKGGVIRKKRGKARQSKGDTQRRMTPEDVERFLAAVEEGATARQAAAITGFARNSFYELSARDGGFNQRWDKARERGNDLLLDEAEEAARTRSVEGWLEPVFYNGKPIGARRKYSDGLLTMRLKALAPERYRERVDVGGEAPVALLDDPEFSAFCGVLVDAVNAYPEAKAALIKTLTTWQEEQDCDVEPSP